jgi:hypothetical protein
MRYSRRIMDWKNEKDSEGTSVLEWDTTTKTGGHAALDASYPMETTSRS